MRHCILLLLGLPGAACSRDFVRETPPRWRESDVVSERTFLPEAFDTLWQIGGAADTILLDPLFLSAGPGGVTVWDAGRSAALRISREGVRLWSFGRQGGGPGEFRSVSDIAHLPNGGVALVDDVNRRLTIVEPNGEMAGETGLGNATPQSVAGLPDGNLIVLVGSATEPFLLFDETGSVVDSLGFPWEAYRDIPLIARQGKVLGTAQGWIFGFTAGNGWWRFGAGSDPEGFPYAEHTEFPAVRTLVSRSIVNGRTVVATRTRPEPPYILSAASFGARKDTLFVHYAMSTATGDWWRLLDLFAVGTGAYIATVRLPHRARRVAIGYDVIYALHATPHPVLAAMQRHGQARFR